MSEWFDWAVVLVLCCMMALTYFIGMIHGRKGIDTTNLWAASIYKEFAEYEQFVDQLLSQLVDKRQILHLSIHKEFVEYEQFVHQLLSQLGDKEKWDKVKLAGILQKK